VSKPLFGTNTVTAPATQGIKIKNKAIIKPPFGFGRKKRGKNAEI